MPRRHGQGREVEDHELFSHISPPLSSHASPPSPPPRALPPPSLPPPSLPQSPRTYHEITALYTATCAPPPPSNPLSPPPLSALSLSVARLLAARGSLKDLSALADLQVYELLVPPPPHARAVTPATLAELSRVNPTRAAVLDAVWATLVFRKFQMTKLPADVSSWRALYERCRTKRGESFERARIRLRSRYNAADASRPEMAISTATLQRRMGGEGGGRRRATGVMTHGNSAIARLRVEFQRNRKRRRFTR